MEHNEFDAYINGVYQQGCIMMSMSLGHDLGLFKVMCAATEPQSVKDVADKLDLKERYTKEWLSCMVAAGILHQDRETGLYSVPDGHRQTLMHSTAFSPMLVHMGKRADGVKQCFKNDGPYGSTFAENPEFFDWFGQLRESKVDNMINFGLLPEWTKQAGLLQKLEKGINVVDIGCGSGNYSNALAKQFPNSTFKGLDVSEKAIGMANAAREARGLTNVTFVLGDAQALPEDWYNTADLAFMSDAIHTMPDPHKCLEDIYKVLKDDGVLTVLDIGLHSNPLDNAGNKGAAMYYTCSTFICLPSSMAGKHRVGYGACWGYEEVQKAIERKFKVVTRDPLTADGRVSMYFFCTK